MFNHLTGPIWRRNNHNFSSAIAAFYPSSFTCIYSGAGGSHSTLFVWIEKFHDAAWIIHSDENDFDLSVISTPEWLPIALIMTLPKNKMRRRDENPTLGERRFFISFDADIDWWCLDSFKNPVSGKRKALWPFWVFTPRRRESRQGIYENLEAFVFIWRPSLRKHENRMENWSLRESQYLFPRRFWFLDVAKS